MALRRVIRIVKLLLGGVASVALSYALFLTLSVDSSVRWPVVFVLWVGGGICIGSGTAGVLGELLPSMRRSSVGMWILRIVVSAGVLLALTWAVVSMA